MSMEQKEVSFSWLIKKSFLYICFFITLYFIIGPSLFLDLFHYTVLLCFLGLLVGAAYGVFCWSHQYNYQQLAFQNRENSFFEELLQKNSK